MEKTYLKQYQILFKKAVVDINIAKIALAEFEKGEVELDLEVVYFHLQQAAEKAIKAVLDFNKIKFIKTHDLSYLINIMDNSDVFINDSIKNLADLTDYAVEGRYSIINDDISDADKYIKIIDELLVFCKKLF